MYPAFPLTADSAHADEVAVGAASAQFTNLTMAAGAYYLFCSSTACWIKQGSNPTAAGSPGSLFVPANTPFFISGTNGAKLAVIQDAAGGKASLCQVQL